MTGLAGAAGFVGAANAATLVISAKPSSAGIILFMTVFLYFCFVLGGFGWVVPFLAHRARSESHSKSKSHDVEAT